MSLAAWHSTIVDDKGNVIPDARVEVRSENTGLLVALYSDRNGTVGKGNPFITGADGFAAFHCIGGAYRIKASGGNTSMEWRYVGIGTAQELDAGAFSENAGWDAVEQTPAGLANHISAAVGFRVLVINADGNGRAAVYEKKGAGASWTSPIWITGVQGANGPPNTLSIGTVTQTATPQVTIEGETPNQVLNFGLVKGDTGDVTPEALAAKVAAEAARDAAAGSASAAAGSATSASNSATTATNQASSASASASTATTKASDAAASASTASTKAGEASASATAAQGSATTASTKAGESAASATSASNSAGAATTKASEAASSATAAAGSASSASGSATTATNKAAEATTARDFAYQWSSAPQNTTVNDGTNSGYSAYHWSKVAETAAGGGIQSVNGKTGANITLTAADVGAATSAQGAKADSALQTLVAGSNISITGTGTSRTISATSAPQVNSDWNATSGVAQILNKPALGTAAYQNVGAFATAAQGAKADSAVQTVNGKSGTSVTLAKADIGLGNVDNTSDANKPISTATQTVLNTKSSYNWIINGDFTVNQRGGVKKPANGVYGYDRWKGHANGIEQIIEALPAGEYTLTWSGGGNGTFGGQTTASPIKATVTGGNTSVVVPSTATKVSVVRGDATASDPWPLVQRSTSLEILLCQRYYERGVLQRTWFGSNLAGITVAYDYIKFITNKRVAPTISILTQWDYFSYGNDTNFTPTLGAVTTSQFNFEARNLNTWNGWAGNGSWSADAEL